MKITRIKEKNRLHTFKDSTIKSLKISLKSSKIILFHYPCNPQRIKHLQNTKVKDAYLDFKRALVRGLKGIFCKPKGR